MSDNEPSVEEQARDLGWLPQEEYKGPAEKFVPAAEYVKKGEDFVPYLRADRKRLLGTTSQLRGEVQALNAGLQGALAEIAELKKGATVEEKAALEGEIKALRRQLVEARQGGDVEAEIAAEEALDTAKARVAELDARAKLPTKNIPPPGAPAVDPEMTKFMERNQWFGKDEFKTATAMNVIIPMLKRSADFATISEAERYRRLEAEVNKQFPQDRGEPPISRTEGGSRGPSNPSNSKTYEGLPQEAKEVCEKLGPKLINPTGKFKTMADYRAHYAEQYFKKEQA